MKFKHLEKNGIFISDEPELARALPLHIDKVRDTLLDLSWTVVDGVDDDDFLELLDGSGLCAADRALIKWSKTTSDEAMIHHEGKDREAEWQTFFLFNFFRPLRDAVEMKNEDTRQ